MCTDSCHNFISNALSPKYVTGKRVLEVGACNVNGSPREFIEAMSPAEYVGVDVHEGLGVDRVCRAENLLRLFQKESFDLVISTEMLEHILDWRKVVSNMKAVLQSEGRLLVTTRSEGFPYHGYPYDFWRYSAADMQIIFSDMDEVSVEEDKESPGIFMFGKKPVEFIEVDLSKMRLFSICSLKKCNNISLVLALVFRLFNKYKYNKTKRLLRGKSNKERIAMFMNIFEVNPIFKEKILSFDSLTDEQRERELVLLADKSNLKNDNIVNPLLATLNNPTIYKWLVHYLRYN